MKKLITLLATTLLIFSLIGCGEDGPPNIRVQNSSSSEANVSFKQEGSSTQNINGVAVGATSEYQAIQEVSTQITGLPGTPDTITFTPIAGVDYTVVVRDTGSSIAESDQ